MGVRREVGDVGQGVADPLGLAQVALGQGPDPQLELEAGDHGEQVGVAGALAVPVGRALHVGDAGLDRREGVGHGAGGVVLAVDAQPDARALAARR